MPESKSKCFVIMPFSGTTIRHTTQYWTEFYEDYLKPLIEKNPAVVAHRSEALRGDILSQIITDLVYSDIVVADLTDGNPNVYWELGVRQSFTHRTITIMESGQELPFDLAIKGTIRYHLKHSESMKKFESQFLAAIADCLDNPKRPDSHVIQTVTGRGTVYEIIHHEESVRRLTGVLSELASNERALEQIARLARANQTIANPQKWGHATSRFRLSALELLVTHRYHEADNRFYAEVAGTYQALLVWNDQLSIWQLRPERTQSWIIRQLDRKEWPPHEVIARCKEIIASELEALQNRL